MCAPGDQRKSSDNQRGRGLIERAAVLAVADNSDASRLANRELANRLLTESSIRGMNGYGMSTFEGDADAIHSRADFRF